jgi:hypothetical protein
VRSGDHDVCPSHSRILVDPSTRRFDNRPVQTLDVANDQTRFRSSILQGKRFAEKLIVKLRACGENELTCRPTRGCGEC